MPIRWRIFWVSVATLLALTGCETILPSGTMPTSQVPVSEPTPTPAPTVLPSPIQTPPASGPETINIWLPPQFDPESGTDAGNLLQSRLLQFSHQNPDVDIEVRVKDVEGAGGILDTLSTASTAAQSALPDLVILPHENLESAVMEGFLFPFDNLSTTLDDPDWYNFAREMAHVQDKIYGLPFAADAQIQVYLSELVPVPLKDSNSVLASVSPLVFQAGDPRALYTLALYQANGGMILDEEKHAFIDVEKLTDVLTFYQQSNEAGVLPYWLTGYQQDDQSWDAFLEGRGDQVITWSSRFLKDADGFMGVAKIPTINGSPFSLSSGWVWALASPDPANHPASVQLAEFLTESSFLAEWAAAMNYLPPRQGSMQVWGERIRPAVFSPSLIIELDAIAKSLTPYPSTDLLNKLSGPLEKATVDVLKEQVSPGDAASQAESELE